SPAGPDPNINMRVWIVAVIGRPSSQKAVQKMHIGRQANEARAETPVLLIRSDAERHRFDAFCIVYQND
ncbi:MAG: hypothetical protein AB7D33_08475, partial [Sphingobium sp.]